MAGHFTTQERVEMVKGYYRLNSYRAAAETFPLVSQPTWQTVRDTVARFESTGSVLDTEHQRTPTVATDANLRRVEDDLIAHPTDSIRTREKRLAIPHSTLARMIHSLGYRPYRPTLLVDLTEEHKRRRVEYCEWFLRMHRTDSSQVMDFWWSDECRFSLDRVVNTHNAVYYSTDNPHYSIPITHTRGQVMCWCALSSRGIIGPYFFEDTVTAANYIEMLDSFMLPRLVRFHPHGGFLFQQDGASAHTAKVTRAWLNWKLPSMWIGCDGTVGWPPKSPDLTPPDFFLWGYLKSLVYEDDPSTVAALREAIGRAIGCITTEMLEKVAQNAVARATECVTRGGEFVSI